MEVHGTDAGSATGFAFNIANGTSTSGSSEWMGTVYAPFGSINIGSGSSGAKVVGALLSGKNISVGSSLIIEHKPFLGCVPDVNAGSDISITCDQPTGTLHGSSTTPGAIYSWTTTDGVIDNGGQTANPQVSAAGTYTLQITNPACGYSATDVVTVTDVPCVLPLFQPPANGKESDGILIGTELNALYLYFSSLTDEAKTLFIIQDDKVLIEVVATQGNYATLLNLLQTTEYGMTGMISNGDNTLLITGYFPIANLGKLNQLATLVKECRPVYPAINHGGLITSGGDTTMRTQLVRNGFGLSGEGIKIGVMSDSYNALGKAATDIGNGDLPANVHVLQDISSGTDEGRAMLQIAHDIAPKAKLSFRTGFITAGDFAQGIRQLARDTCNVIVDDISYITEPFFKPGVVSKAITDVSNAGVQYVTAAGNFGDKSYESAFNPMAAPAGLTGRVHNFGGGDYLQNVGVTGTAANPGVYTIVLQWQDDIYSLGESTTGAVNDLDIYITDKAGKIMYGFNKNNIGADPIEVLGFKAVGTTELNIMVVNATGATSNPARFKYLVFRGDLKINEYNSNGSTIVGQANTPEAITVGAIRYYKTPAFGVDAMAAEAFSSIGGTYFNNAPAHKPDLVAPNGVNTSINFSSLDYENDGVPNFFGTSASAPHVAGAVALIQEARIKFYEDTLSPAAIKELLTTTAIPINGGFNYTTGAGLIQVDAAIRTMANPKPEVISLEYVDPSIPPGTQAMTVTVHGNYFTSTSKVVLDSDTLTTTYVDMNTVTTTLPVFGGDRFVYVFNPIITPSGKDGGLSNGFSVTGVAKKDIKIVADNQTKKFGEQVPTTFTSKVFVNGEPLETTSLTLHDLGLDSITYTTNVEPLSDVGIYNITPERYIDPSKVDDPTLETKYNYQFVAGAFNVTKMPLLITPVDKTVAYGQSIGKVDFNYQFDQSRMTVTDAAALRTMISQSHQLYLPENALAVIKDFGVTLADGSVLNRAALQNLSMMVSLRSMISSRVYSVIDNKWVLSASVPNYLNNYYLVDVSAASILNFISHPETAAFITGDAQVSRRTLCSAGSLANGTAQALSSGTLSPLINGNLAPMINAENRVLAPIVNRRLVQMVYAQRISMLAGQPVMVDGQPVLENAYAQMLDGQLVQLIDGVAVPVAENSFYLFANRFILKYTLGQFQQLINGVLTPIINVSSIVNADGSLNLESVNDSTLLQLYDGTIAMAFQGALQPIVNRVISRYAMTFSTVQIINGQRVLVPIINSGLIEAGANSNAGVIIDSLDAVEPGWLGSMFSINMISGLDAGQQYLVPGMFPNSNFEPSYGVGNVTITKQPITIRIKDTTKLFGETLVLDNTAFSIESGSLAAGDSIASVTLTSAGTAGAAKVGNYQITSAAVVGFGTTDTANYAFSFQGGTLTVLDNPCLITHGSFTNFGSTPKGETSLWVNVEVKMSGQLVNVGDYISFKGGSVTLNNISSSTPVIDAPLPDGRIEVANVQVPVTYFNSAINTWITQIPAGYSSTSDIFMSGGFINSTNGFMKKKNANSLVKGIFNSNKAYSDQWSFSLAAYQPVQDIGTIAHSGDVVPVNGTYKAGTPLPIIGSLVSGGSGNGGNNYTGNSSSMDNFSACGGAAAANQAKLALAPQQMRQQVSEVRMNVYPNPTTGEINISFVATESGNANISIFNVNGTRVMERAVGQTIAGQLYNQRMSGEKLAPGVYMVRYQNGASIISKKLIIRRP
jgi:hypothetical protein